jgi:hypothetical protein
VGPDRPGATGPTGAPATQHRDQARDVVGGRGVVGVGELRSSTQGAEDDAAALPEDAVAGFDRPVRPARSVEVAQRDRHLRSDGRDVLRGRRGSVGQRRPTCQERGQRRRVGQLAARGQLDDAGMADPFEDRALVAEQLGGSSVSPPLLDDGRPVGRDDREHEAGRTVRERRHSNMIVHEKH